MIRNPKKSDIKILIQEMSSNEIHEKNQLLSQKKNYRNVSILENPPLFNGNTDEGMI